MTTLESVHNTLQKNVSTISLGLKVVYCHILAYLRMMKFLAFQESKEMMQFRVSSRLIIAPQIFNLLISGLLTRLISGKVLVLAYFDDFLIVSEECVSQSCIVRDAFQEAYIIINKKKSCLFQNRSSHGLGSSVSLCLPAAKALGQRVVSHCQVECLTGIFFLLYLIFLSATIH